MPVKKYFIQTFGCYANEVDSKKISGILEGLGFKKAKSLEDTDLFLVNTCSIRQKSEDKVYGLAKKVRKVVEKTGKKPLVILAGCMVGSATGKRRRLNFYELKIKTPWVDCYISPDEIDSIFQILVEKKLINKEAVAKLDPKAIFPLREIGKQAFVNISSGCDNFCAFCVVPYARGGEKHRSKKEILEEIRCLVDKGVEEIILCGQNVNSWGLTPTEKAKIRSGGEGRLPFADLVRGVHEIKGVKKISFMSSNPFDFTQDLIKTLILPKISNYIHIAVQSGNNDVLKRMNRRHTVEEFSKLINAIKKVRPDMGFGTDIIVGFPGETWDQFMDTVKLFQKIPFKVAFISMYSPRKGTPAAEKYADDVPLQEKKRRHAYLTKIWKESLV